jgi:two-component system response regulator AtoC
LRDRIPAIAETACTVLIRGESGVGKSLLADLLHYAGPNRDKCLLKFNCACLPPEQLEAALGSAGLLPGGSRLEGGGSLVLDEVAALPMPMQGRLLHAIEIGRFDTVHLIALSAVDMEHAVARRSLREDLYLRLNLTAVTVPPLRERRADISALARHFLKQFAELHRRPRARFTETALSALESYSYPGNVRELRGIVESAVLSGDTPEITLEDLRPYLRETPAGTAEMSLDEIERQHIAKVLDFTRGKKTRAADILGISRKTLLEKRKRYGFR